MNSALQSWLEVATRNLAPRAVTQISYEITAHVQSAAVQHRLEGMDEELALELAVRELVSAKAAVRGYRLTHLRIAEFKALSRSDSPVIVMGSFAFVLAVAWQFFVRSGQLELTVFFSGQVVFNVFLLWAKRHDRFERRAFYQFAAVTTLLVTCLLGSVHVVGINQQMPLSLIIFGATVGTV